MTGIGARTGRIAVIGGGISGMAAALGLAGRDVVLYEAERRLGGHTATVEVDYDGARIAVDTGFIVYNELNYPSLTAFFRHFGVETQPSDMSFSVSLGAGRLEWAGHEGKPWRLFAQPENALKPGFWRMLAEILRFNRVSTADRAAGRLGELSLGDYLTSRGFSRAFQTDYLVPMGAAIWSTATGRMLDFPADTFVRFFENHRLLGFDRPVWRTVTGGSQRYVERIAPHLPLVRLASPVARVERTGALVRVVDESGHADVFDHVVIAAHSDQALELLADASEDERAVLGAIRYQANDVVLHRDPALMPTRRAAWSAWNYLSQPTASPGAGDQVSVTYWMNLLQSIDRERPLFVSLNPPREPRPDLVFGRFSYAHPQFDRDALAAQARLPAIQGARGVWFAGAWTRNGFHEDGLVSGMAAARGLGGACVWAGDAAPEPTLAVGAAA